MRRKERIPIILKKLKNRENLEKILEVWFKPPKGTQLEIGMPFFDIPQIIENVKNNFTELEQTWQEFPEARLPQIFIITDVMDNYPGGYYYMEDSETLSKAGVLEAREIIFWGSIFDSKGDRLIAPLWRAIKDLETSHIEAIVKEYKEKKLKMGLLHFKEFEKELKRRQNGK